MAGKISARPRKTIVNKICSIKVMSAPIGVPLKDPREICISGAMSSV
jgi:hypothetical protein